MNRELILVADDDEDIVRFVEVNLRLEGFEVVTALDGEQALEAAFDAVPDLALLDVMMPKLDGVDVVERLRSDPRTRHISIIMLTAKSMSADKVVGLTAGADDYMTKPFDPVELVARVRSTLRRTRESRDLNPLTHLPGNLQVQAEVTRRLAAGEPTSLLYVDIDNFKPFNDYYGFVRGDECLKLLADTLVEAVGGTGHDDFVGHIGGDDFLVVASADEPVPIAEKVIALWDRRVLDHYDAEDRDRGYIEVPDRHNDIHRFEPMSLSIGIVTTSERDLKAHWEAIETAAALKERAKRKVGSAYELDLMSTGAGRNER